MTEPTGSITWTADAREMIAERERRIAELEKALRMAHRFVRSYLGEGAEEEKAIRRILEGK